MRNLSIYSDLAVEARDLAVQRTGTEVEGVLVDEEEKENTRITRVTVETEEAARAIGKAPGHYITIDAPQMREGDRRVQESVSQLLAMELEGLINFSALGRALEEPTIFVVGLGNWNATPDALGPQVLNHTMVTRHLYGAGPPEMQGGLRPVCALAPGVLGLTGIETAEIIRGVVNQIQPDLIIAIDALSARSTERLSTTLQLCDSGIRPGSGVGQKRFSITEEEMGIPVIAIGVPTVIHAISIASDAIDRMLTTNGPLGNEMQNLAAQKETVISEVLQPFIGELMVAPKGIDQLIQNVSKVIAGGLNVALHPGMGIQDVTRYL